jgi:hypothetical protein
VAPGDALLELECRVDSHLSRPRVLSSESAALRQAANQWSAAIWAAAAASGPLQLRHPEIARGKLLAHAPVFVCGVHRSGTTLLRDLLDGHPALSVLPSEGTFFTNFERHLQRIPTTLWLQHMGGEWLRRLANPIHQGPYWLLGRSSAQVSRYVEFAQALMAWWPISQGAIGGASSWPLVAVALAYAQCTGGLAADSPAQHWAEKTPTNERFLARLYTEFPRAKVVHIIRNPYAVYASHLQAMRAAGERFTGAARVLQDLARTYRVALAQSQRAASDRYLLLRYENLIEDPQRSAELIAAFLQVEALPILTQPTAAGIPAVSNSSFSSNAEPGSVETGSQQKWVEVLSRSECERVSAVVGAPAAQLGYQLMPVTPWRARLIRAAAPITSRLA